MKFLDLLCLVDGSNLPVASLPAATVTAYLQAIRARTNIHCKLLETRTECCSGCIGGLLECGLDPDVVEIEI